VSLVVSCVLPRVAGAELVPPLCVILVAVKELTRRRRYRRPRRTSGSILAAVGIANLGAVAIISSMEIPNDMVAKMIAVCLRDGAAHPDNASGC
jgi:hypothetical protein